MICCQRDGYLQELLFLSRMFRMFGNVCFWFAHVFDRMADRFERARRDAILLRHPYLMTNPHTQTSNKMPWEWTTEERRSARIAAYAEKAGAVQ